MPRMTRPNLWAARSPYTVSSIETLVLARPHGRDAPMGRHGRRHSHRAARPPDRRGDEPFLPVWPPLRDKLARSIRGP